MSSFRRATRCGEIDVLVVSDGVLPLPAAILATNATRPSGRPCWTTCSCRRVAAERGRGA